MSQCTSPDSHAFRRQVQCVRLSRASRSYGSTWALRNVSVRFEPGPLHLVVGPNGSGKSTLLGLIGTLLTPSSGSIFYEPEQSAACVRREIGWGSHEALMYLDLSPKENIRLHAQLHGIAPDDAWNRVAQRFGLVRFADRPLRLLSRGQRQRVALARALSHEPSLLLLDEPTTGLDTDGTAQLCEAVEDARNVGVIAIVVTHDPSLYASIPCRQLRLNRGALVP